MPVTFTTRSLVCVLLALSLYAPMLAMAAPAADRDRAAQFGALAAPSSSILLSRIVSPHDHARQRPDVMSLFTLVPMHGGVSNPGHLAAAIERCLPRSLWTAGPWTGRSPPAIS